MADYQAQTAFVFGCGYLGFRVAKRLIDQGWRVGALTRSPIKARQFNSAGITPFLGDWADSRVYASLPQAERVVVAVGFDGGLANKAAAPTRTRVKQQYLAGLSLVLRNVLPSSKLVYVSSTGVYHQSDGGWVDENAPARPARDGGSAHLLGEELVRRQRSSSDPQNTITLRMSGLYGPGRVPRAEAIRRGEPIHADSEGFLNLIHIDDAARCVLAAWDCSNPDNLYVIADGHPVVRATYYEEIARILRCAPPRYTGASQGGLSARSESNKRIWNARMRRDLLSHCQFPSYREGLREILLR